MTSINKFLGPPLFLTEGDALITYLYYIYIYICTMKIDLFNYDKMKLGLLKKQIWEAFFWTLKFDFT